MIGLLRRVQRFMHPVSGRALILPLDHGASEGLLPGLTGVSTLIAMANERRVQAVVLNKGMARTMAAGLDVDRQLVVQLSGGTKHGLPSYNKSIVCSVPEALRLGADAVSVHVNIGNDLEDRMLADLGLVTDEAHLHGLPVMAVVYPKGGQIVDELDPSLIAHCIRLGGELGADLVSTPFSGHERSYADAVASCPCPVLVAGGPYQPNLEAFLKTTAQALDCGAAGASVGRNIFQREDAGLALDALAKLVHGEEA